MSETEKIMMYNSMKKSPVAAGFLEIIPTAGYAYSGNWKKGLAIRVGIPVATAVAASFYSGMMDIPPNRNALFLLFAIEIYCTPIYSFWDVATDTSKYNKRLYKQIFGKEAPNLGFNLYPLQDGVGISLTYLIN